MKWAMKTDEEKIHWDTLNRLFSHGHIKLRKLS